MFTFARLVKKTKQQYYQCINRKRCVGYFFYVVIIFSSSSSFSQPLAGTAVGSGNYTPIPWWASGAQIIALNYQVCTTRTHTHSRTHLRTHLRTRTCLHAQTRTCSHTHLLTHAHTR